MPKILIIGATGYLGKRLARVLVQSGQHQVFGVARSEEKARGLALEEVIPVLCADPVNEPESYLKVIRNYHIDVIVDVAGANNDSVKFLNDAKIIGEERLQASENVGVPLAPRLGFIYCSGTWVHGSSEKRINDLDVVGHRAVTPPSELVAWRVAVENAVLTASKVLHVAVIRPALIYGYESTIWTPFWLPILRAAKCGSNGAVQIPLEPDARPGLIHVDDVATGFKAAIEKLPSINSSASYPVFDLVTSQESMRAIFDGLSAAWGHKGNHELVGAGGDLFAQAMSTTMCGSSARAQQLLAWEPKRLNGIVMDIDIHAAAFEIYQPSHPEPVTPTTTEQSLSHYFHTQVSALTLDEFDIDLWPSLLPQVTHSMTAVWHASNAIAGLSWTRKSGTNLSPNAASKLDREGSLQYSASIKHILQTIERGNLTAEDKTMVLLTNILYAIYVMYSGDGKNALAIHERSCQLIRSWKFWQCVTSGTVSQLAAQVLCYFIRLENSFSYRWMIPRDETVNWQEAHTCLQSAPLATNLHAYIKVEFLWSEMQAMIFKLPLRPSKKDIEAFDTYRSVLYEEFTTWDIKYAALLAALRSASPVRRVAIEVWHILMNVLFQLDFHSYEDLWDETCWDKFEQDFKRVLDIVEKALEDEHRKGAWAYEVQIAPTIWNYLHFTTTVCRMPTLRRRSAQLLRRAMFIGMREIPADIRIVSSGNKASTLQQLIDLEESGWYEDLEAISSGSRGECTCIAAKFVCNFHRVAKVCTRRDTSGRVQITFITVSDILNGNF
ncbi:hypothetical protein NLG97_g1878 [Lecanicillium saksenae]|uniref:Uncharacterized protein n=1 Tax=Lecanicillium saksenae TaxID=468837 RepID=A0ACC1R2L5_9HYPO|nr:hypothetical protein NLG97_g1878 [Lecanicillium saksenae]